MGIQERKEREKQQRRRQIQDAAKSVFLQKGYKTASMEDIARRAELSPATIYLYFKSKEELYASLNLEALEFVVNKLEKIRYDTALSVEDKLMRVSDAMLSTYEHDRLTLQIIFHVQLDDTLKGLKKELLDELNALGQKGIALIAEIYEDGVRAGLFVAGNSLMHADILWSMFTGLVMWEEAKRKLNPDKDFLRPTLARAFRIFLDGVKREVGVELI